MVVLSFVSNSVLTCTSYIPQSIELVSIVAGDAGIPPYEIRVLWGGTDIEFRGGLRAGSARELKRILAAVPQAKVLHIESPGGRIREAQEMIKLVRERGLTTYTSEECESAATLVLMSGKERVVAANAKVGFHSGTFPGLTAEQQRAANELVRSTMQSAGVSQEFINRVLATPPDQMWYPSIAEMFLDDVVTSQSYGERFASSISEADLHALIEKLGEAPWFTTIREFEPETYSKMVEDFTTAVRSGRSEGEALALVDQSIDSLMKKYYAAAADEALLVVLRDDWIELLRNYKDINSRGCIVALGIGSMNINRARALPDWHSNRPRINEMVMRSGASKIPIPIDRKGAEDDLDRIMASLTARCGNDARLLDDQAKWMDNSQKVCDMLLTIFEQMASLPGARGANVVRYFLTVKSSDESQAALATSPAVTYRVVKTDLNLRAGPGANYPVLAKLPVGTRGITPRNGRTVNGPTMWQEVSVNGYTGWVNEIYIEAEPEIRKAKPVH
jgi:Predicted periplasmic protein